MAKVHPVAIMNQPHNQKIDFIDCQTSQRSPQIKKKLGLTMSKEVWNSKRPPQQEAMTDFFGSWIDLEGNFCLGKWKYPYACGSYINALV